MLKLRGRDYFQFFLIGEEEDELTKCLQKWLDIEYLHTFFTTNQQDLNSDYYGKSISISQAISSTRDEAYQLFERLGQLAVSGATGKSESLSLAFQPLNDGDYYQKELQQQKAKTNIQKKWLRLYAIKIAPNTFIVTGGAIKLVHKMSERQHLQHELKKLNDVRYYLLEEGILDQDDFETFEI